MTLLQRIQAQPSVIYRRDPWFYWIYDGLWLTGISAVFALVLSQGWGGITWQPWMWALLPVGIYVHVLINACVHNACHGNFPRAINRLVGEVLGLIVLTRFASWEIIHVRHHKHSDDTEKDPHCVMPSFWKFLAVTMMVNVERQLQNIYFDQYGDTPADRRREKGRSVLSFGTMGVLISLLYVLLGWQVFVFLFLPIQTVGWIVVAHFNWVTHNAKDPSGDYHPINIDEGVYWIGNRIWFGIYMHGNHHKRANIFNPLKMEQVVAKRRAAREAKEEAAAGKEQPAQAA